MFLKENHFRGLLFQEETIYFFFKERNLYIFIDHGYLYVFKRKSFSLFISERLLFQKEMIFFIDHEYLSIFLKENHFFFLKKKLVCFNFSLIMDIFISLKEDHFQGLLFQEETIYIFF